MRFSTLRILLWAAALTASAAFAVANWPSRTPSQPTEMAFVPKFALADAAGGTRKSEEFRGKFQLVFFGFTNCPDVCPTTLSEVAQVMEGLGSDAESVQPIFISVDPERDRRLGLAEYTNAFHPSIIGLAGSEAETEAVARSFKVYFMRNDDKTVPGGYSMSHSPALYLIGPDGDWLRQFSYGTPAAEILADLQSRL